MLQEMLSNTNFLAVLACGVAAMAIGFVWYGPLFGKQWAAYTGWTEEKIKAVPGNNMGMTYGLTFVLAMVMAFVLTQVLRLAGAADIPSGMVVAAVCWLGFVAATEGTQYLFEHKPLALFGINQGYNLLNMLAFSIILTLWK